jgi:PAS domain S-box-containing protein
MVKQLLIELEYLALTIGNEQETNMKSIEDDFEGFQRLSHASVENAVYGIFWLDAEGRIYRANYAACRLLGYTKQELLGMKVSDFDPDYQTQEFTIFWRKLKKLREYNIESIHKKKDGSYYPAEISSCYVDFEGKGYSCTFFRDITERKRSEESLRSTLKELEMLKERLQEENFYLQEEIMLEHNFGEIIGQSEVFKKALMQVEQVAITDTTVFINGETGTGKELIARAIHDISSRKNRPLVKVNCAALPSDLIESDLFGHEKGAFTGALTQKIGRFELADGGTIFLDEIGDIPKELQVKLLRVLQEGEFERVGNPNTIKVDVRVIAATNRELEKMVAAGDFREDLFYRLNVFPINLPPLRKRKDDIPMLVKHFIQKYNAKIGRMVQTITKSAMNTLQSYHWPGNVRELENIIERALVISQGTKLELGNWFSRLESEDNPNHILSIQDLERKHILKVLDLTSWRVSGKGGAAEILDLKPTTLEARMKKLGIKRS